MTRIEEIRAREQAATVGPWYAANSCERTGREAHNKVAYGIGGRLSKNDGEGESWTVSTKPDACGWDTDGGYSSYGIGRTEAEFIAAARTDIPWLLTRIDELSAALRNIADARPAVAHWTGAEQCMQDIATAALRKLEERAASRLEQVGGVMDPRCEICGTTDNVRVCPIMTGSKSPATERRPVCGQCIMAWYESGGTTPEEILAYRQKRPPEANDNE